MTCYSIISAIAVLSNLIHLSNAAVLDTKGHHLRTKSKYYILPVNQIEGFGLTMSPKNTTAMSMCPLYVSQENFNIYPGLPAWFLPSNPKQRSISLSSDVNILFNAVNFCLQSSGWRLTLDHDTNRRYVAAGGAIGNPGEKTLTSWFKIEKVDDEYYYYYYKIVFCPSVCEFCMVVCGDVGVFVQEDGTRLLGLSQHPLHVMFKKA